MNVLVFGQCLEQAVRSANRAIKLFFSSPGLDNWQMTWATIARAIDAGAAVEEFEHPLVSLHQTGLLESSQLAGATRYRDYITWQRHKDLAECPGAQALQSLSGEEALLLSDSLPPHLAYEAELKSRLTGIEPLPLTEAVYLLLRSTFEPDQLKSDTMLLRGAVSTIRLIKAGERVSCKFAEDLMAAFEMEHRCDEMLSADLLRLAVERLGLLAFRTWPSRLSTAEAASHQAILAHRARFELKLLQITKSDFPTIGEDDPLRQRLTDLLWQEARFAVRNCWVQVPTQSDLTLILSAIDSGADYGDLRLTKTDIPLWLLSYSTFFTAQMLEKIEELKIACLTVLAVLAARRLVLFPSGVSRSNDRALLQFAMDNGVDARVTVPV